MAYLFQHASFQQLNETLSEDMISFVRFCRQWRLKPNISKTVSSCFHLTNQAANKELDVIFDGVRLTHDHAPVYLGVKLDRSLTYKKNAEKLQAKLGTRHNLPRKLTGTSWGATTTWIRSTALGLVYSCAAYCCSTWLNSVHTSKIYIELNKTMRLITGTVESTPIIWLSTLSNIAPPPIRRQKALRSTFSKVVDNDEAPLHHDILVTIDKKLKSRKPSTSTRMNFILMDSIQGVNGRECGSNQTLQVRYLTSINIKLIERRFRFLGEFGPTSTDSEPDTEIVTLCYSNRISSTIRAAHVANHTKQWLIYCYNVQSTSTKEKLKTSQTWQKTL